jgi:hypothetical protein
MTPADLTKPFSESCCDGGICYVNDMSCQPCGCDKGAHYTCERHEIEKKLREELDAQGRYHEAPANGD